MMYKLKKRAIEGILQFQIAMGIMIFLPAFTIYYWQAWLYWILFSTSVFMITLYFLKRDPELIERRMSAGPAAEKQHSQKIIQSLSSVFLILVYLISGFDINFKFSNMPFYIPLISDLFVLTGLYIIFRVFKENTYTSGIVNVEAEQKVISTGPYSLVRHPMYSGAIMVFLFTPAALGSYLGLIPASLLSVLVVLRLHKEEKYLLESLKDYDNYKKKVTYKIIPFIY